jgi:hypothetical protein
MVLYFGVDIVMLRLEGFVTDKIPFWPTVGKDLKRAMRSAAAD